MVTRERVDTPGVGKRGGKLQPKLRRLAKGLIRLGLLACQNDLNLRMVEVQLAIA
jgi:hypothetical protein